jgi:hypothetical protein
MSVDKRLQKIMQADDRLFRAMEPGQFGRSSALKSTEKRSQKRTNKKKKRDQARIRKATSQFDVGLFAGLTGVLDVLTKGIVGGSPEVDDGMEEGEDTEQGQDEATSGQESPQKGGRVQEEKKPEARSDQPPKPRSPSLLTGVVDKKDDPASDENFLANSTDENPFVEIPDENPFVEVPEDNSKSDQLDVFVQNPKSDQFFSDMLGVKFDFRVDAPDLGGMDSGSGNAPSQGSASTPKAKGSESKGKISPRVQKRREAAQKEKEAAARNFRRQRGEQVPPPVAGIPEPAPISDPGAQGEQQVVNDGEKLGAMDAAASKATEFAQSMVNVMGKLATELQALAVKVRNIESVVDRL